MTYSNIRTLILDVHSKYTASKAIVFENTIDVTALQFRLVDGSYYYTLPKNANVTVFINDTMIDSTRVDVLDRYKGLVQVVLDSSLFVDGVNKQYEFTLAIYCADSDSANGERFISELKTSIMYSSGSDDMEQAILNDVCPGTTVPKPTHPNPHFEAVDDMATY